MREVTLEGPLRERSPCATRVCLFVCLLCGTYVRGFGYFEHPRLYLLQTWFCRLMVQIDKHTQFVFNLDKKKDTFEYWVTEHLRMSGIYWGLSALCITQTSDVMDKPGLIQFVLDCQNEDGGFGGCIGHDSHLLYTLSAVQILMLLDALDRLDKQRVIEFVRPLQQPDGSFAGDQWGEVDTRFSYCALSCMSLLGALDRVDVAAAGAFVARCQNWDGGFGVVPDAESHCGQIFCCVGALAIAGALGSVDVDALAWWMCERQCRNGGLNGRPEKLADVCYSWWVLSSLAMLRRLDWIDKAGLVRFITECEDKEDGGYSDKPGNMSDVFHTFFALAGLSLLGHDPDRLAPIDPVYAMPPAVLRRHGVVSSFMASEGPE